MSHQITPVTGNDDPRHAPMTLTVLSSLQSQRNVSRTQTSRPPRRLGHTAGHGATELGFNSAEPAAPLQGSGPGATPPATLLQGSSTSPPSTLAHSYTPICTTGSHPCTYKRRCPRPSQKSFESSPRRLTQHQQKTLQGKPSLHNSRPLKRPGIRSLSRKACIPYYKHPGAR
jgi:hypothetical protein